jgi:hypothetical protein
LQSRQQQQQQQQQRQLSQECRQLQQGAAASINSSSCSRSDGLSAQGTDAFLQQLEGALLDTLTGDIPATYPDTTNAVQQYLQLQQQQQQQQGLPSSGAVTRTSSSNAAIPVLIPSSSSSSSSSRSRRAVGYRHNPGSLSAYLCVSLWGFGKLQAAPADTLLQLLLLGLSRCAAAADEVSLCQAVWALGALQVRKLIGCHSAMLNGFQRGSYQRISTCVSSLCIHFPPLPPRHTHTHTHARTHTRTHACTHSRTQKRIGLIICWWCWWRHRGTGGLRSGQDRSDPLTQQ